MNNIQTKFLNLKIATHSHKVNLSNVQLLEDNGTPTE